MSSYYVNNKAQANGDHEVHKAGCPYTPTDWTYLGEFTTCAEAVIKAKGKYPTADGCKTCSAECHKS